MTNQQNAKAPWTHRVLVWSFGTAMCLLVFWLRGFVVNDIGTRPGPLYEDVEAQQLDKSLIEEQEQLEEQTTEVQNEIGAQEDRQKLLRDSTQSSERTMNQLLEIHRLSLQKDVEPSDAEKEALAEAEQLFLDNQRQYQELNANIVQLNEQLRQLEEKQRDLDNRLTVAREPVREEFQSLKEQHDFKLAAWKLAVLVPLLAIAVWLFLKMRHSTYAPPVYAFGIAVAAKIALVMHEHFPTEFFKYVLILAALAVVVRILIHLLQMVAHPERDWVLKQYREAYERFMCPICGYPIRRGPLKYLFWTRRSIRKLSLSPMAQAEADAPYACPACGAQLFEKCDACGAVRHALLPVCESCGSEKPVEQEPPPVPGAAS